MDVGAATGFAAYECFAAHRGPSRLGICLLFLPRMRATTLAYLEVLPAPAHWMLQATFTGERNAFCALGLRMERRSTRCMPRWFDRITQNRDRIIVRDCKSPSRSYAPPQSKPVGHRLIYASSMSSLGGSVQPGHSRAYSRSHLSEGARGTSPSP